MQNWERNAIEIEIAGASVCWEPALRVALDVLPLDFLQDELCRVAFYWAAGVLDKKQFDGVSNPDRLAEAMERAKWPASWDWYERQGWTEGLWTGRMYDLPKIRKLCESLVEMQAATVGYVKAINDWNSNGVVQQLLRETVPPPAPSQVRPLKEEAGLWHKFRR